jgi:methenyltetrahydromethanopterin cyclohydrolase
MLAQAVKNAGLRPLVVDLFADLDMQDYAEDFRQVKSLAEQDLVSAVDYFIERYAVTRVIYGSGFECHPQSLCYLNSRLIILGNHPDIFARQQDKQAFFSTLDQLNIPHPEVVFSAPAGFDDWLLKPMQGQGGVGIRRYHPDDNVDDCMDARGTNPRMEEVEQDMEQLPRAIAEDSVYWQKFQAGTPHSVLFLADGQQVQVIGFNRLWSVRLSETQEFVFSGVINNADLADAHKAVITDWLNQMVPAFGLKGLNSLDFIHGDDCSYVLEINPRPSASMQLYDKDLLGRHIQSYEGAVGATLVALTPETGRLKSPPQTGYQVVYAEHDLIIPDQFEWPEWCMDLPESGDMCRAGQPICSIIAHQKNSRSVVEQLLTKQQLILSKLERF